MRYIYYIVKHMWRKTGKRIYLFLSRSRNVLSCVLFFPNFFRTPPDIKNLNGLQIGLKRENIL